MNHAVLEAQVIPARPGGDDSARQEGRAIRHFATAVFDLVPILGDHRKELPKTDPGYYFRPYKTILVRTVAEGGESFYFCGDHRATLPALRSAILDRA